MDIYFRAFELEDAIFINSLRRIDEMESKIGGTKRFVSLARETKWVEDIIYGDFKDLFYVAACEKGTDKIVGYTSVSDIDHINKSCFWSGIKISPDFSGRGFGTQIALLILKYVFEELGMERCIGKCLKSHDVAKKLMEKVGYKVEGLQRHIIYKNGEFNDQYLLSILKEEYNEVKEKFKL
ncbi:MAG: GNAT family protein [Marinifilaceae bacterium]